MSGELNGWFSDHRCYYGLGDPVYHFSYIVSGTQCFDSLIVAGVALRLITRRKLSSRMRTVRLPTVSHCTRWGGGVWSQGLQSQGVGLSFWVSTSPPIGEGMALPSCGQNDRSLWKHYLHATSFAGGKYSGLRQRLALPEVQNRASVT